MVSIITGLIVTYTFLNVPFYGNVLPPYDSSQNPINFVFKFGVAAKNELDTFDGTFTKDLGNDGTITARMILSKEELRQIQLKLIELDFFSCPETFLLKEPLTVPSFSYSLLVYNYTNTKYNTIKEVNWNEGNSIMDSVTATKLTQIANFLTNMIDEKPEYQKLPPANGMDL